MHPDDATGPGDAVRPFGRAPLDGLQLHADSGVTLDVVIQDGGHTGRGRLTVLRFRWHPSDPLAVDLLLSAQPDHPALPRGRWVVLRDFLRYGLEEPTGDGSVRIRPDEERDRVELELERQGRPITVTLERGVLRDFLDRTEAHVPCGEELSAEALTALLQRLQSRD